MTEPSGALVAGDRIAHYRILEPLGAGGMGEVYRAHDDKLGREVALKVLPAGAVGDATARERLLREARTASALNHPHICTIYEVGEADGRTYIAMELIRGRTLDQVIPAHGLPPETVARYGAQIADALSHAHEHGVVHRDLKSANVMITPEGRAKVLDFGLARHGADPEGAPLRPQVTLTVTGMVAGTPHYLAPEVLRGEKADARSDLWALGVLLHEMASGELPFKAGTEFELMGAILNSLPAALPPALPPGLRAIVQRLLAKDPAQRYRSAAEVRAALEAVLSDAPAMASGRAGRNRRTIFVVAAVAAIGAAVATIGSVVVVKLLGRGGGEAHIRSLAVLPLQNLSGDKEQEYFADGMTEELIASLGNLEDLRVISRTSVMRYKNTTKAIPQIGRELGVDAVIEGSALRAGDRVRITAQLVHCAQDRHLWAQSYERDLRDVLALQSEVAQAIAGEVRTSLNARGRAEASHKRVVNPAAYEEVLQGRYYWSKRNPAALREAIRHFERALAIDSSYAAAYAGLAEVYAVVGGYIPALENEGAARGYATAKRALELDPQLAGPHAVLGLLKTTREYDWSGAQTEFQAALELDPHNTSALHWHAIMYASLGRQQEALAEVDRALSVDPLGLVLRNTRGRILQLQRHPDEAMAEYRRILELDPSFFVTYIWIAMNYEVRGQYAQTVANYRTADSLAGCNLHGYDALMRAAETGVSRTYWRQQLVFLNDTRHCEALIPSLLARCYARLGEMDSALVQVQRALETHDSTVGDVIYEAGLDPLRSDPRFIALLRKYGFAR